MRHALIALALGFPILAWGQDPKPPPPSDADQEKVRKDLRDAYRVEYARKGREDKKAFAAKLWAEAGTAKTPLEKYVLLQECRSLAAESMDLETALASVDAVVLSFDLKPEPLRDASIAVAKKAVRGEDDARSLAEVCLSAAQRAWSSGDYGAVLQLANAGRDLAQSARETSLVDRAKVLAGEATETRKEFDKVVKAEETLSASADDAEAHGIRGRYFCLLRGEWAKGLANLEKAAEPLVRDLASKEKVPPASPEGQLELATGWADLAAKEKAPYKRKCQERALHWIEQAWPQLNDRDKARTERRLDELEAAVGRVNLLLAKMTPITGVWGLSPKAVKAPEGSNYTAVEILYVPPPEYDIEILVKYNGIPSLFLGLMAGQTRFATKIDNRNGSTIHVSTNKPGDGATFGGEALPEGKVVPVVYSVRRDSVSISANGATILRYRGPLSGLTFDTNTWKPKYPNTLWLGYHRNFAGGGQYEITRMTLIPLGGRGQRLR
jgi:hypothetical protein